MQALPRPAQGYILLVIGFGGAVALLSFTALWGDWPLLLASLVLAGIITLLDLYPVKLPVHTARSNQIEITISTAVKIAALIVFPPPVILLANVIGTVMAEWQLKRVWYKLAFNTGSMTVTYLIMAAVYSWLHQPNVAMLQSVQNVVALIAMGVADLVSNSIMISLVVALASRTQVTYIWAANFKPFILHELSMVSLGVALALLYEAAPWSLVLAAMPLAVVRYSYQAVTDLREQTREALQALARVLDERDQATSHHSELVAEYAGMIARELHLRPGEVDTIVQAAWLHDIGKIGMRNDILYKEGALTSQEREDANRHAVIGGELLQKFPLFKTGAIYVRHHHERWNGQGYPDGLAGEAIPLGARILAVADAYQAMTDLRPYRKPLSEEAAIMELCSNSGTQFDPRVVDAFLRAKALPASPPETQQVPVPSDQAVAAV